MIKIKNVSTSTISLYVPSIRFNRELAPGRAVPVSEEEYEDPLYNEIVDYELNNPFMVCDENEDCDEYISSYNFKKGHSYRICTKFQYKNYNYFLPAFSFYPSNTNNNYICLNIFVLITYLIFLLL